MTDTDVPPDTATVKFETKSVQTIRGTEKLMISKWEKDGWELVTQNPGNLRTELVFRRPKPKIQWKLFAILGGALVVVAIVIIIGINLNGGDETDAAPAVPPSAEAAAPRDEPSNDPEEPVENAPFDEAPLTAETNAELAALLSGPADGPTVEAFAQTYAGQLIEFDGSIGAMNNHEGYTTRYDILITYGDYSETHSNGGTSNSAT